MVKTSLGIDLNVTPFLHNHDAPSNISDDTVAELNKMSLENKKLREMLAIVSSNIFFQNRVNKSIENRNIFTSNPNKRKLKARDECNTSESMDYHHPLGSLKTPNNGVTRVYTRTDPFDKSLVVKDKYQWIKYGQKATKDNPSPRAYYKCSFAPNCPVKKKVQRSVDDANLLVVIYEGEHNHQTSMKNDAQKQTSKKTCKFPLQGGNFDELVEKMVVSLRRNPDFIEELVKAISTKV